MADIKAFWTRHIRPELVGAAQAVGGLVTFTKSVEGALSKVFAAFVLLVIAGWALERYLNSRTEKESAGQYAVGGGKLRYPPAVRYIRLAILIAAMIGLAVCLYKYFTAPFALQVVNQEGATVGITEDELPFLLKFNEKKLTAVKLNRNKFTEDHITLQNTTTLSDYVELVKGDKTPYGRTKEQQELWQRWIARAFVPPTVTKDNWDEQLIAIRTEPFTKDYETFTVKMEIENKVQPTEGAAFLISDYAKNGAYDAVYQQVPITIDEKGRNVLIEVKTPNEKEALLVFLKVKGREKGEILPNNVGAYNIILRKQ